ncbi:MAG: type II toxin-antitoxin system RelE/ParE family toxin [Candidatus Micrarchaeota archaeon]
MFSVEFSTKALKAIRKTDAKLRQRMHELAGILATEPVPVKRFDVTKLSGSDGFYRIRLSSFRVKYFIDWSAKKIQILDFQRRDEHTYD